MLFRPTFLVNPLHAQFLDCLHPVCSSLLTCIFGVNIPTVGMQKLRPKSSWKALKPLSSHLLSLYSFHSVLWRAHETVLSVLCNQVCGSAVWMWAGQLCSPRLLWLLLSPPYLWSQCYVVLSWFSGGSHPVPFNCPALGAEAGWFLCVPPLQGKSSMRKPWLEKHTGTVPSELRRKCGHQGADSDGEITAFTPECTSPM